MPAAKKHPSTRARANKATTAKTIAATGTRRRVVPTLPPHPTATWHAETRKWWTDLWKSSLPDAWESFDKSTLFTLALCFNDIWIAASATARKEALGEYRLQRRDFFIAPYNRLQGEIVMAEADAATARAAARKKPQGAAQPKAAEDPRLKLVQ